MHFAKMQANYLFIFSKTEAGQSTTMPLDHLAISTVTDRYRVLLLSLIAIGLWLLYQHLQPVIDYAANPLFDGNQYLQLYRQFNGQEAEAPLFPFHSRILVPWLASLLPLADPVLAFGLVNLCFIVLGIWALDQLWRHLQLPGWLIWMGFAWWLLHWSGAIRINTFDPLTVDLPIYALQGLLLLFIFKRQPWHLLWLAPLATAQKESFIALLFLCLLLSLLYHFRGMPQPADWRYLGAALVLALLTKEMINTLIPYAGESGSSLRTLGYHAKLTWQNPFDLLRWLAALVSAGGAFLLLATERRDQLMRRDFEPDLLLLLTLCYWGFGLLAGRDMLRIIFLGLPFYLTWLFYLLRDMPLKVLLLAGVLSFPFLKIREAIPDPAIRAEAWAQWYPSRATPDLILMWLGFALICWLCLRYRSRWLKST